MKQLDPGGLQSLLKGALAVEKTTEGVQPLRFTMSVAWKGGIQTHPAGIRLESVTDAEYFRMRVRLGKSQHPLARGAFDLFLDGRYFRSFIPDAPYTEGQVFAFGSALPPGPEKKLVLYFPTYRETEVLETASDLELRPGAEYPGRILFLGDSITHGYGTTPGFNYAAQYARHLGLDFVNLGIGGACFPDLLPEGLLKLDCCELVIAYGCNDTRAPDPLHDTERRLRALLAFAVREPWRITVLSPCHNGHEKTEMAPVFAGVKNVIRQVVSEFPAVRFLDGFDAFPNEPEYFVDGTHLNTAGAARLAELLFKGA